MFPTAALDKILEVTPKFNPDIVNGMAVQHLKFVEQYIEDIFRSVATGFPPGLKYLGGRRCTPIEEFREVTKKKINRCVLDVSTSDVYLMRYDFSYEGVELPPKYLFLPYVNDGGIIHIRGSRYVISPVLSDRVFSIEPDQVFVRLLKARLKFQRLTHNFVINGVKDYAYVVWSDVYNKKKTTGAAKIGVKAKCTLAHYLFCKYGVADTFKTVADVTPVIGCDEINEDTYPPDNWVICYSSQLKPRGYGKSVYQANTVRLAFPINTFTPLVKNLVAGFYYVTDHFPARVKPEYINDHRLWMKLLGLLIWSENVGEGKLYSDVQDHINSLDEYIETIVAAKLKDIGYSITNIYELFVLIIEKHNEWISQSDDKVSTMYDKELSILYYICYELISAINILYFKLMTSQKKELNINKIKTIMNQNLRPSLIFTITKNHGEISTASASGNNKALKLTLLLVPQSSSINLGGKKARTTIEDPGKRLHASIAEIGGYANIPKSAPDGRSRISPYVKTSEKGLVLRDPKFVELLDTIQTHFKR